MPPVINMDECMVEFKTSVSEQKQLFDKIGTYHLKKYKGKWKIYNTEGLKELDINKPSVPKIL